MDESDESFNLYSNAVGRLQDSDDEDLPQVCPKSEENSISLALIEPDEKHSSLTNRRQRRKEREFSPMCNRRSKRTRARTVSSLHFTDSNKMDSPQSEMLKIVELTDLCSPKDTTNWDEVDEDEGAIIWQSNKSTEDILREGTNDDDIVISSIDIEEDLEIDFHVKWRMKPGKVFHLKKMDTMKQIFEHFAKEEGVPENQILLTYQGKPISPYDTREKFKGSFVVMLEGRLKAGNVSSEQEELDPNQIELKVLTKDKKEKLTVRILRTDNLEVFMEKTAKLLELPRSQLLFKFDGETIDSSDTPESLDMDGGECIEVIVRS